MRLLDTKTLELKTFLDERNVPKYAILSHTWGEEEVTFEDLKVQQLPKAASGIRNVFKGRREEQIEKPKAGFLKLQEACKLAVKRGFSWIWVDTCCIDKSSSAELSEAINSMFRYYEDAQECYAYLEDVDSMLQFEECRWFTRGWTLQELVAPLNLRFYLSDWTFLGDKQFLVADITRITGINESVLSHGPARLRLFSIANRMSWAARRKTTRAEDTAYCLMGLFDVNMPLLYGEGAKKAFSRLQRAIMADSSDHSIFAWTCPSANGPYVGFMAQSPNEFRHAADVVSLRKVIDSYTTTNQGLEIKLPLLPVKDVVGSAPKALVLEGKLVYGILDCHIETKFDGPLALVLYLKRPYDPGDLDNLEIIGRGTHHVTVPEADAKLAVVRTVHIPKEPLESMEIDTRVHFSNIPAKCIITCTLVDDQIKTGTRYVRGIPALKDFVLHDTDIYARFIVITFFFDGARQTNFAILIRAMPTSGCGVRLYEFPEPTLKALRFADFEKWLKRITPDKESLDITAISTLHTSTDIFIQASLSKEQRLGKDVHVLNLTVFEDEEIA
jgi:hypothetical protein